ncbi:MAG TPA: hypothetical protein VGO68_22490 [Pyrinomonadaceae bacterium]|jgi:hypothetical protein|nr:hypothetical protein [Pyrinomonadaceae bacterium]
MNLSVAEKLNVPSVQLQHASLGVALRNILATLAVSILTLVITGSIWREQGYEMLIVAMGWPHVLLGFSFFFGRALRGERDSRTTFLLLALATIAICAIHYRYSITGLIYLYFLFHLFRDEIFVYLQTRARHRPGSKVYAVAGLAPLILLLLLVPRQQDFRHDLRRVEFAGTQVSNNGWTLIPFKAVPNSRGRDFYFYVQAPQTAGVRTFITHASSENLRSDGEMIVGKGKWDQAEDLVFRAHYVDDASELGANMVGSTGGVPVLLTGGHSVGQVFRAEKDQLAGVWLPIDRLEQNADPTRFVFHLASPPLLPYSEPVERVRTVLIWLLAAIVIWRLIPRRGKGWQLWIYLAVLAGAFAISQTVLKTSNNAGYAFPLIFQFAVVFHYWSWYVFSFDKLRVNSKPPLGSATNARLYDRLLSYLGSRPHFTIAVIGLNAISILLVLWYYRFGGPSALRYFFDYNYFLYFLVFHVTFSFRPTLRRAALQSQPA